MQVCVCECEEMGGDKDYPNHDNLWTDKEQNLPFVAASKETLSIHKQPWVAKQTQHKHTNIPTVLIHVVPVAGWRWWLTNTEQREEKNCSIYTTLLMLL